MEILKKIIFVLLRVVFVICVAIDLLMIAGTLFKWVPLFGTIANVFTVGYAHVWLIFVIIITICTAFPAFKLRSRFYRVLGIISAVTLICGIAVIFAAVSAVNTSGGNANFFRSYLKTEQNTVTRETVRYENTISKNSLADIYYEKDEKSGKPVVLYIHGGGWTGGSRHNNSYYMEQFALNGYIAVSAEYDLSSKTEHRAGTDEKQLTYAAAWIKNNISKYGGDTARFYVVGDSAGGNLALDLAYKINSGVYKNAGTTVLPSVTAVSVLYPVTDMKACYYNDYPLLKKTAKEMVSSYTGATPSEDPALYAFVSPINYVTKNSPPTCVFVGEHDAAVAPTQSYRLVKKLDKAGVADKLVSVPYANHLCDMGGKNFAGQGWMNITFKWFEEYE